MKRIILIMISIIFMACVGISPGNLAQAEKANGEIKWFTIAEGRHRSDKFAWRKYHLKRLDFIFQMDSSAIYKTNNPVNQGDINKLYGLSDGTIFHHKNSARFGWRWYNDQLEIWAYTYFDGKRDYKKMGTVELNKKHQASIIFAANQYIFLLNDQTLEKPRNSSKPMAFGYKLLPYFGGDEKAPHPIRIMIEEL